jgi:hypothetical protein
MLKKNILLILVCGLLLLQAPLAYGQGNILPTATGPSDTGTCRAPLNSGITNATYCGNYALNDFVVLAINIAKWLFGIVGSLTLVMFIYGGIMFLVSAGSPEAVSKAKKIIVAAVIGLIIVFSSYLIIQFVLKAVGLNWDGSIAQPTVITK